MFCNLASRDYGCDHMRRWATSLRHMSSFLFRAVRETCFFRSSLLTYSVLHFRFPSDALSSPSEVILSIETHCISSVQTLISKQCHDNGFKVIP